MSDYHFLFPLAILLVAFLYSSVGHGGASGYLALMALFSYPVSTMKVSGLILNVFVASIAFFQYYRGGHFKWKLFLPFALASVPFAFIGSGVVLEAGVYKKILAVLILFPVLRLFGFFGNDSEKSSPVNFKLALIIGAVIGLLSGMIGIGGGIILSPVIILLGWGNMKETAAVSALFIMVNSVSGLAGAAQAGAVFSMDTLYLLIPAVAGGFLGSYLGSRKFQPEILRPILATVLLIACIKLFWVA
jgi:hypothetical protein